MTTADEHRIMLRQAEAVKLRVKGKSYSQIAEELSICKAQAYLDVKANLTASAKERAGDTESARELELQRLDHGMSKVSKVLDRDIEKDILAAANPDEAIVKYNELLLKAVDRIAKISSERSKLLGLYSPDVTVNLGDVSPDRAAQLVREKFGDHAAKDAEPTDSQAVSPLSADD